MNDKDFLRFDEPISFTLDLCQEDKRNSSLYTEVKEVLDRLDELFREKNEQYRTKNDELANFTTGGFLRHQDGSLQGKFEALKDMAEKHVAKVYNGRLLDDKMDESFRDLAVYFIIAAVMHKRAKQGE